MTRYLITGGAGFVGSHLTRYLVHKGHDVVALDRIDSAGYMGRLDGVPCKFVRHDLAAGINKHVDQAIGPVDMAIHLAAASHVDRSVSDPMCFLQDNILGTYSMLQWARTRHLKKLMVMSTDEVFGAAPIGRSFSEHDVMNPSNPYAGCKAAAELLVPAWAATWRIPAVIVRSTNLYGSGQDPEKFIPLVAGKVQSGDTVQIHADADCKIPSTRCYLHVSDACRAFELILEKGTVLGGNSGGRYNLSGGAEVSNLYVAEQIAEKLGKPLKHELVSFVPNRPRHDMRYAVSWDRLKELGWSPEVGLDDGLREALGEFL